MSTKEITEKDIPYGVVGDWRRCPRGGGLIYKDATVQDTASVWDSAIVGGKAMVRDSAIVQDKAIVRDRATVRGNASVGGSAIVGDNASVRGNAMVRDGATVQDTASVWDNASVEDNASVRGSASVSGNARVRGSCRVTHTEQIQTVLGIGSGFRTTTIVHHRDLVWINCGCWSGTLDEFASQVAATYPEGPHRQQYDALIAFVRAVRETLPLDEFPVYGQDMEDES